MLAEALEPYGSTLLWRAFVYDVSVDSDRAKCANVEFEPLDGKFWPNVLVQAKNGPVDFQPREPFHPLFGAMEQTPLALQDEQPMATARPGLFSLWRFWSFLPSVSKGR